MRVQLIIEEGEGFSVKVYDNHTEISSKELITNLTAIGGFYKLPDVKKSKGSSILGNKDTFIHLVYECTIEPVLKDWHCASSVFKCVNPQYHALICNLNEEHVKALVIIDDLGMVKKVIFGSTEEILLLDIKEIIKSLS